MDQIDGVYEPKIRVTPELLAYRDARMEQLKLLYAAAPRVWWSRIQDPAGWPYDQPEAEDPYMDQDSELPEVEVIEIGCFGMPAHDSYRHVFSDTWADNDGYMQYREIPVPDDNFVITSGGRPIYFYLGRTNDHEDYGLWLGSEMTRRSK